MTCDSQAELSEHEEAFSSMATSFRIIDKANKAWVDNPLPRRELEIEP
jgi:hypothetical protein